MKKVCRKFNDIGSKMLSRGFVQLEKRHMAIYKKIKSMLPRRESERRAHPLQRHCDILQAVETRISMLSMTYMKYIEHDLLCFIPGKVLDEINSVLRMVETNNNPPRAHQLLQELRDLSSMAIEHFDEHISPRVKEQMERKEFEPFRNATTSKSPRIVYLQRGLTNKFNKVKKQNRILKHHIKFLDRNVQKVAQKLSKQNKLLRRQALKIKEQDRKIQDQATKIEEQEAALADIKKHMEEWQQKYREFTAKQMSKDSALTQTEPSCVSGEINSLNVYYKSNIKPRTSRILPNNYTGLLSDVERKRKMYNAPLKLPLKMPRNDVDYDIVLSKNVKNENNNVIKAAQDCQLPDRDKDNPLPKGLFARGDLTSLISDSIGSILTNAKTRKRKMLEDIDLK